MEFNDLLNGIAKDIEEHIHLLEDIKEMIEQEKQKQQGKDVMHPMFKYQSPMLGYTCQRKRIITNF